MRTSSVAEKFLPADEHGSPRRLRLPHIRRAAAEVVATARAQRWEPAEVLRALFTEAWTNRAPFIDSIAA
jgi:hypothetical protein